MADEHMTTTMFLVRHASHGHFGKTLTGRLPGMGLTEGGRLEAQRAGHHLARSKPTALYASPLDRTLETAAIIAEPLQLTVQPTDALTEIDFGAWTGRDFQDLDGDPAWDRWNQARDLHRPPEGESMLQVQLRAASWMSLAAARHPDTGIVAVSHCDVIKAMVAYALGLSIVHHHRLVIDPASVSKLVVGEWGMTVHSLNEMPL